MNAQRTEELSIKRNIKSWQFLNQPSERKDQLISLKIIETTCHIHELKKMVFAYRSPVIEQKTKRGKSAEIKIPEGSIYSVLLSRARHRERERERTGTALKRRDQIENIKERRIEEDGEHGKLRLLIISPRQVFDLGAN